jgi:sulfate transport system substrate-binding protein
VTFVERGIGDVYLMENEALLVTQQLAKDRFDIVTPSVSIRAEPPVAIVDRVVDKRGSRKRPRLMCSSSMEKQGRKSPPSIITGRAALAAKHAPQFRQVSLFTIEESLWGLANRQRHISAMVVSSTKSINLAGESVR